MVHELISERKSIRAFSEKSIDDETLLKLFEAARWAPSSRNEQPWRFIVARKDDKEQFEKILSCLNESNKVWAKFGAALFITLAKKTFSDRDLVNVHAMHDVGFAMANLTLQATANDLFMHQMGGINPKLTRELFEVPEDFEIVSITVIGYKGDLNSLPDQLRERELKPRVRKNLNEILFTEKFGNASAIKK